MRHVKIPIEENGFPVITTKMKTKFMGEFSFPRTMVDGDGNEIDVPFIVPWITCKEIFKEMVVFAASEKEQDVQADAESRCVHPQGYIKSVRICGLCGEQL